MELVPVAYYGSLMSVLQQQLDAPENHQQELVAIAQLMSILFPTLSVQVLRNQFTEISSALMELSQSFSDGEASSALDRYLLTCYAFLIAAQESAAWNSSLINTIFQSVLVNLMDERPKVRKAAILSVRHVLSNVPAPLVTHPGSNLVVRISQHSAKSRESNPNGFIHIMAFLKDSWQLLNFQHAISIVDYLLKHLSGRMSSLDHNETHNLLAALDSYARFMTDGSYWTLEKCNTFVLLIVQDRPNINDTVGLACWLSLLKNAMTGLGQIDGSAETLSELMPKLYQRAFNYLQQTPHKETHMKIIHEAIEESLQSFVNLITLEMINDSLDSGMSGNSCVEKIVAETEKGLGLQFQSGWPTVFRMIGHLMTKMGYFLKENAYAMKLMNSILETLSKDELYAENPYFSLTEEFFDVIGIAIQAMGPSVFLSYFPLNLEADTKSRAWILPLLKENIRFGELKYFIDYLIPLSIRMALKGQQFVSAGKEHEGKTCAVIWRQIWDLLPSFSGCPTDLQESFEALLQLIIPIINSDDDRVYCVCEAVRIMVTRNQGDKNLQYTSCEKIEANLNFLSGYTLQLLPVLFNKYVMLFSLEEKKNAKYSIQQLQSVVLESVKSWISIASVGNVDQFFQATVKRYLQLFKESKNSSVEQSNNIMCEKHAVFDLANAMIPSYKLSAEALGVFYKVLSMELTSSDATIQKKTFKSLASLLRLRNDEGLPPQVDRMLVEELREKLFENQDFVDTVCQQMIDTTMATEMAAKKVRLAVLCELITMIDWHRPVQMQLIPAVVSEVILATKEANEKTRNIAYSLLVSMAHRFSQIEAESNGQAEICMISTDEEMDGGDQEYKFKINLEEYFKMIFAGFAGKTPFMISATIHACSRLLYEFNASNGDISHELLESIVQSVLIFCEETKNREIIRAALGFLKVFIVTCPDLLSKQAAATQSDIQMLEPEEPEAVNYLQKTVEALLKWSSQHKSHFRVPCRHLIERIVRKCGLESVEVFFPEDQGKLLANIRKKRQRALRKKEQLKSVDGSHKSFEDFMDDIEEEDEQNDVENQDDASDDDLPQVLKEMVYNSGGRKPLKSALKLIEDDEENPIDFLQKTGKSTTLAKKQDTSSRKNVSFEEKDGKLVITDSENEDEQEELMTGLQRRIHEYKNSDSFRHSADGKKIKFSNKRTRDDDEMLVDTDNVPTKPARAEPVKDGKFMSKKQKIAEREMKSAGISTTGKEYRSLKAKGDVKREGKPDPFAYIPLNAKVVGSQKSRNKQVKVNKKLFYK